MRQFIKPPHKIFFPAFILIGMLVCSSCTTTVYYPVNRFAKKEEKTVNKKQVKEGVIEFMVFQRQIVSPPPGVIRDYETARKRGHKEAEKRIGEFCSVSETDKASEKYSIQSITTGTKHSGWRGHTSSYYGSYTGFSTTSISPVYRKYTAITFKCE